jgi:hypothetical protein
MRPPVPGGVRSLVWRRVENDVATFFDSGRDDEPDDGQRDDQNADDTKQTVFH